MYRRMHVCRQRLRNALRDTYCCWWLGQVGKHCCTDRNRRQFRRFSYGPTLANAKHRIGELHLLCDVSAPPSNSVPPGYEHREMSLCVRREERHRMLQPCWKKHCWCKTCGNLSDTCFAETNLMSKKGFLHVLTAVAFLRNTIYCLWSQPIVSLAGRYSATTCHIHS